MILLSDEVVIESVKKHRSIRAAASELGTTTEQIRKHLRRAGYSFTELVIADLLEEDRSDHLRRVSAMVRMRKAGMTLEEIGGKFGLTKQRVGQILKRAHKSPR